MSAWVGEGLGGCARQVRGGRRPDPSPVWSFKALAVEVTFQGIPEVEVELCFCLERTKPKLQFPFISAFPAVSVMTGSAALLWAVTLGSGRPGSPGFPSDRAAGRSLLEEKELSHGRGPLRSGSRARSAAVGCSSLTRRRASQRREKPRG